MLSLSTNELPANVIRLGALLTVQKPRITQHAVDRFIKRFPLLDVDPIKYITYTVETGEAITLPYLKKYAKVLNYSRWIAKGDVVAVVVWNFLNEELTEISNTPSVVTVLNRRHIQFEDSI